MDARVGRVVPKTDGDGHTNKNKVQGKGTGEGAMAQSNCVNFDEVWCHKFWSTIYDCEGYSVGCFFKLMCHSPCVCPEWKKVRCGGKESGSPEECNAGKASMFQALLQGNTSSRNEAAHEISDQTTSLDESLSGKRTCR